MFLGDCHSFEASNVWFCVKDMNSHVWYLENVWIH